MPKKETMQALLFALVLLFSSFPATLGSGSMSNANKASATPVLAGTSEASPAWLEGWTYRRSHTINGTATLLQDYQVKIVVHYGFGFSDGLDVYCNNHCKLDFGDVRFTSDDGVTLLSYWIQKKIDGNFSLFWIKVNSIPSYPNVAKVYVYYGNPDATTASNGSETFLYYESWENFGADPKHPNWQYWSENTGSDQYSGQINASDIVCVDGTYSGWKSGHAWVERTDLNLQNVVGEVDILIGDYEQSRIDSAMAMNLETLSGSPARVVGYWARISTTKYFYRIGDLGSEVVSSVDLKPTNEWHTYGIGSTSSGTKMWIDDEIVCSTSTVIGVNATQIGAFWWGGGCRAYWDAWRIRQYVDPEPIQTYWSSELARAPSVGGYSIPVQFLTRAEPVLPYIILAATLTAVFTKLRPKTKRKRQ